MARLAGIELDPWQQVELGHAMGESADWKCRHCTFRSPVPSLCPVHPSAGLIHPWAAFECCDVVPRQNGKSEKMVVRMLAGLFILEEPLQIYSAHLFDTAMEIFRRLVFVIENCDELRREVKHRGAKAVGIKYSHGEEGIELRSGLRVRFKARTGSGGRGFSCDTLFLDEAMILPEQFLGATVPTLSARPNPQVWFGASAPDIEDPTHDGMALSRRRLRALAGGDGSLAYFEHSAEGERPDMVDASALDDPQAWAQANPGLGIRITPDYVARERAAMGARQFAVERLGIGHWPDPAMVAERVIPADVWAVCAERDAERRIVRDWTFALDANFDQTWGSVAVAGVREDDLLQVAVVHHERSTDWMLDRALTLHGAYPDAGFVLDKRGPLAHLIAPLKEAGIRVVETSSEDYGDACAEFVADVSRGQLRYPFPQPELSDALASARRQSLGDRWKWSRKHSTSGDISPLVAVTLARWGVAAAGATLEPSEVFFF